MVALSAQFANQDLLPRATGWLCVEFEAKAGGVESPDTYLGIAQVFEQHLLKVVADSDVNPLASVEYPVNARSRRRVRPHGNRRKSEGIFLGKWHGDPFKNAQLARAAAATATHLFSAAEPIRRLSDPGEQFGCRKD